MLFFSLYSLSHVHFFFVLFPFYFVEIFAAIYVSKVENVNSSFIQRKFSAVCILRARKSDSVLAE